MFEFFLYTGIAVNIAGAILLVVYAIGRYKALKSRPDIGRVQQEVRDSYSGKRAWALGLMLGGGVIVALGLIFSS